jgi:hypothetical protein
MFMNACEICKNSAINITFNVYGTKVVHYLLRFLHLEHDSRRRSPLPRSWGVGEPWLKVEFLNTAPCNHIGAVDVDLCIVLSAAWN